MDMNNNIKNHYTELFPPKCKQVKSWMIKYEWQHVSFWLFISYIFKYHTEFSPFWPIDVLSIEDLLKEWKHKLIVHHYTEYIMRTIIHLDMLSGTLWKLLLWLSACREKSWGEKGRSCQRLLSIRFSGWVNEKWLVDLLSLWQKAHNLTLQEWVTRHVMSSWPLDNLDLFGVICCIIAYCLAFILLNEVNRKRLLIIHRCLYSY